MDDQRKLETVLAEAVEKRAEVRIKPVRDPRTGNLTFTAQLLGESRRSNHLIVGTMVISIPLEPDQ